MRIKESVINYRYRKTQTVIATERELRCECCRHWQGQNDVVLSYSHLISRADCKKYDLLELIYDPKNIRLHCMGFGTNKGCHAAWENGELLGADTSENLDYVKKISEQHNCPELYQRYYNRFEKLLKDG